MSDDEAQARLDNYLSHMLEAAHLARQYVRGVSKDEFLKDRRTQQVFAADSVIQTVSEPFGTLPALSLLDLNLNWTSIAGRPVESAVVRHESGGQAVLLHRLRYL